MTGYIIRVSDNLLEGMTLAAVEAYCFGKGNNPTSYVETLGYVWGYKKNNPQNAIFYLDRMSISISAKRAMDSVTPNVQACALKNEIIHRWSPQLTYLGDFHSHPYESIHDVKRHNGFEFSADDFANFKNDDYLWERLIPLAPAPRNVVTSAA